MIIDAASLTALSNRALERAGLKKNDAETVSGVLVAADMMGISTHGVLRLTSYTERLTNGAVDPGARPEIEQGAPSLAIVDGMNAIGPVAAEAALKAAIRMTAETGIAYVGCRNSNHAGAMMPYALDACRAGFVMIGGTGASATMPPFGGAEARIGNNPLCIAAPIGDGPHFVLDMAISVAARGKIRAAQADGRTIPEGWAVDASGKPTTDPEAALKGFLVAVGGHKGSGLSMGVDILSNVLAGAKFLNMISSWSDNPERPQELGHFFILIDPTRLIGRARFDAAMRDYRDIVCATPAADPASPVMVAGMPEQARMARALKDGIDIKDEVLAGVRALAGE